MGIILTIIKHFIFLAGIGCVFYYLVTLPKIEKSELPKGLINKVKYQYKFTPKKSRIALKLGLFIVLANLIFNFILIFS
jgi:hypothetical protein